ncbi:PREDICTED: RING1 and YY1-binding protein-like isoform X2 [Branchiostoma belcheri]|uniref:RING1 and YY1-binding protein-like isoform X2 n=1 Tax=Branchiostoma belcheri TaxID=7741 RepID=A0A6P4Z9V2_BRABE|nr:PREDICTED: RING1 and YY1-binding protein-like isoform X2 [Branchiostoma belcheri]
MTDKGEQRRSPNRPKRDKKTEAEGYWECSVCTFRNNAEAFKCSMCDVRKGTSTRKPRLNSQLVAQQVAQQFNPPQPKPPKRERERGEKDRENGVSGSATSPNSSATVSVSNNTGSSVGMGKKKEHSAVHTNPSNTSSNKKMKYMPRLKNVDRSTATHMAVTVNNVTVIITDYKEKAPKSSSASSSISSEPPSTVTSDTPSTNTTVAMATNLQESPTGQQNGEVTMREQM